MTTSAIIPLNVAALRVSQNDHDSVVAQFKGRVATFERLGPNATTGDALINRLETGSDAIQQLGVGLHLHWELPDHFRRGVQPPGGGATVFPTAPNRWLVTRALRLADPSTGAWGEATAKSWVVQSDALFPAYAPDRYGVTRPAVPAPVATTTAPAQSWQYMGRVVELEDWLAGPAAVDTLPNHVGPDGKRLRLTAVGFVGPGFAAYYPECCSVFGFWDSLADRPDLVALIRSNAQVRFETSYQVIGWIDDASEDPLATLVADATALYAARLAQCRQQKVAIDTTPAAVVTDLVARRCKWSLAPSAVTASVAADGALLALDAPTRTLCAGVIQEVVWDSGPNQNYTFLANRDRPDVLAPVWTSTVELAAGNSPIEALSVLLKNDLGDASTAPDIRDNDEFLLDALQVGLLYGIEKQTVRIVELEEALHSRGFAQTPGGLLWVIQPKIAQDSDAGRADRELTLPLALAEQLAALNAAQKAYDQARAALEAMRRQLFLDWFRYVKLYTGQDTDSHVDLNALVAFVGSETNAVVAAAQRVGLLDAVYDPDTRRLTALKPPAGSGALANAVWTAYQTVQQLVAGLPEVVVQGVPAPPFWLPNDPVLVVEGERIEPARRNGASEKIAVRSSRDIIGMLTIAAGAARLTIAASAVKGVPAFPAPLPMAGDLQALAGEAWLTVPMLAGAVVAALAAQGGEGNIAASDPAGTARSLAAAQGGLSPQEATASAGLFAAIRAAGYVPVANPSQSVAAAPALTVVFTNAGDAAYAPDPVGWSAQTVLPEFSATRYDPFLPVYLIWGASLDPLARRDGEDYAADNMSAFYTLGPDAIDNAYLMPGGQPVDFASGTVVPYTGSSVLSKRPIASLVDQIDRELASHPDDSEREELLKIRASYAAARIMSQALSGFGAAQTLRAPIPGIPVEDLIKGARDQVTARLAAAIKSDMPDDWYQYGFNTQAPIATGLLAQGNFGPLRGGLMKVTALEIVDVFGQRMQLSTRADGIDAIPAYPWRAQPGDARNAGSLVLPPRVMAPTRLWFRWLSAAHDATLSGDFVEMNTHPATTPVCGWILPNHLDDTLAFYDADGAPIGSFGLEHGDAVYRSRPGRLGDHLDADIGPRGAPTVNPHVADVMWRIAGAGAGFLRDLIATILASDAAMNAARGGQDVGLAVLMGRPLAIARAVLGLETLGGVLPLSQADAKSNDPFPSDVAAQRFAFDARQAASSADLGAVRFAARLGDIANLDDGLVGYMLETGPGAFGPFTSYYAPDDDANGVEQPQPWSLALTLNAQPLALTMLLDPRASVHAATGILPVEQLAIPSDQYADALRSLAVSFVTHPVLRGATEFALPAPAEPGYDWSWIAIGAAPLPMRADASDEGARAGYSPQILEEGWLQLQPAPSGTK